MRRNLKRIIGCMCAMSMFCSMTIIPSYAADDIRVQLDEEEMSFDVPPQIINERTMVPMRAIFEALGADVDWDGETKTVTAYKDNTVISLTIDSPVMYVNENTVTLDAPACVIDDRTLVPVRAISEASGCEVLWDGSSRTVQITTNKTIIPVEPQEITQDIQLPTGNPIGEYKNKLSLGKDFVSLVKEDGSLWMWGHNNLKQISDNEDERIKVPTKIMDDVEFVSCGDAHTAVIKKDGSLWLFGDNTYGQLGNGNNEGTATPQHILDDIIYVDTGNNHTLALDKDGNTYIWGSNDKSQLGSPVSTIKQSNVPIKIAENIKEIGAESNYSVVVDTNNKLYGTGNIQKGTQLNASDNPFLGDSKDLSFSRLTSYAADIICYDNMIHYTGKDNQETDYPKASVDLPENSTFVFSNENGYFYLKDDQSLYLKGTNTTNKRLPGDNRDGGYSKELHLLDNVVEVQVSELGFVIAILSDGSLWTWGNNTNSTLGNDNTLSMPYPFELIDNVLTYKPIKNVNNMPHKMELIDDREYERSYAMILKLYDKNGNIVTPIGSVLVKIKNTSGNTEFVNQLLYIYDYMYDEDGTLELEVPNHYIGTSREDTGIANITFKSAFYSFDSELELNNLPINTKSSSGGKSNSSGSRNGSTNSMYDYYNNIVSEKQEELRNVKSQRNTQVIIGGRTVMTYDEQKARKLEEDIAYYKKLRDSYK